MWGPPGTFSLDCLESPTPETYASGGNPSSSVVPRRPDIAPGAVRHLRAIPLEVLEVPLLSTVIANPSLFTCVPPEIFLRLFKNGSDSHYKGFHLFLCFSLLSFFSSYSLP